MSEGFRSVKVISQNRIEKKLAVLRGYVDHGIPPNAFVPRSINQFRAWEDEGLGLEKVGSPNTMSVSSSPHNADLIEAVKSFIELLKQRSIQSSPDEEKRVELKVRRRDIRSLNLRIKELESLTSNLAGDWHMTRQENVILRSTVENLKKRNADLVSEVSKLRKEFKS